MLAAGQLCHIALQLFAADADFFRHLVYLAVYLVFGQFADFQAKGDIFVHGHGGEQGVALEYHANLPLFYGFSGYVFAVHQNLAAGGDIEAYQSPEGGGFAAPGGTKEGEEFSGADGQVQVFDCCEITVFDIYMFEFNHLFSSYG